jgi:hypothetical protein
MSTVFRTLLCGALVFGVGFLQGCSKRGSQTPTASLSGKVTYNGKPLTGGNMTLRTKGKGDTVIRINADGSFEGTSVPLGEMSVAIDTEPVKLWLEQAGKTLVFNPKDIDKIKGEKNLKDIGSDPFKGMEYVPIPKKYTKHQESGLTVTVKEGKQEMDFPLVD